MRGIEEATGKKRERRRTAEEFNRQCLGHMPGTAGGTIPRQILYWPTLLNEYLLDDAFPLEVV